MEVVHLGKTELPTDVVEEYIQSLGEIYTPEVCRNLRRERLGRETK